MALVRLTVTAVRAAVVFALLASGCIIAKRSLTMPGNDEATVALLTGGLPRPMKDAARHPWFAVRMKGEQTWRIYEVGGGGEEKDPFALGVGFSAFGASSTLDDAVAFPLEASAELGGGRLRFVARARASWIAGADGRRVRRRSSRLPTSWTR